MKAVVLIAVFAVLVVLVIGLSVMMRGNDPKMSNKLMQLRVLVQAIALVVIMAALWLTNQGPS